MGKIRGKARYQDIALTGKKAFVLRPMRYSTIKADELLALAADDSKLPYSQLTQVFDGMRMQFAELLCNGHSIQFGDLGTFRPVIHAKAVNTPDQVSVDRIRRRRIVFTPSPSLKRELNNVSIDVEVDESTLPPKP